LKSFKAFVTSRCSSHTSCAGQFLSRSFVVLLRKSIPQNHNLKTAAELGVMQRRMVVQSDEEIKINTDQRDWMMERGKHLQFTTTTAVESGLQFLFITNTGGAASALAYLGAIAQKNEDLLIFKTSLAFFFVGIILVGLFRAYMVEVYGKIFWDFNSLTKRFMEEEMEWEAYVYEAENQALKYKNNIGRIMAYFSFFCFILGSIFGVVGLLAANA
jgi:hypothetical protein